MAIPVLNNNTISSHQPLSTIPAPSNESTFELAQQSKNAVVIDSQVKISMQSGDQSMSLLYKTAIAAINEKLAPTLGENATQNAYDNGLDTSPQATADRIVKGATDMFTTYREDRPELSDEEAIESFMSIISEGINTGFTEAKDILDGLSVLNGEIEENITSTFDLVQKGLNDFRSQFSSQEPTPEDK